MTNQVGQIKQSGPGRNVGFGWLPWLWWMIGIVLLPFTTIQTVIPIAAWLAPVFLLRFARVTRRTWTALLPVFLAYAVGLLIATRGAASVDAAHLIFGIVLFPVIRGVMYTLPYAADRLIGSRVHPSWRVLVFPLAFASVDWLMSLSSLTNTTGSPAYSQYDNLALLQLLSVTGMWAITFLIMWFAATVNALWEQNFDWRPVRANIAAFAAVLLAVFLFGGARLSFFPPSSQEISAATITLDDSVSQRASGGIDWLKFNQSTAAQRAAARPQFEATVDQLLTRTEIALRSGAKIVGWQEGAATVLEEDVPGTLDRVAALARAYDAYLEVSLGVLTRTTDQHFILNESILVDNTGAVQWTYNKTYPVIPDEAYIVISGNGRLPAANTSYGRLGTAICNDLHFLPLLRQAGAEGVDILIAPFNDFHPWESEDAIVATYRAIENGFSLVRPAGHGISTIVDYVGRMHARQDYYTEDSGIMFGSVPRRGVTTPYSRIGDVFAYLCLAGFIVLSATAFWRRKSTAAANRLAK